MKNVLERYFDYIQEKYNCKTTDELFGKKYIISEPLYCGNLTRIRLEKGFEISKWTTDDTVSTDFDIKEVKDNILEVGYCYYGNSIINFLPPLKEYSINQGDIFLYKMLNSCERARSTYSKCNIISISMNFDVIRNALNPMWENKLVNEWSQSLDRIFKDEVLIVQKATLEIKSIADNIEQLSADNMVEHMKLKIKAMEFITSVIIEKNQHQFDFVTKGRDNIIINKAMEFINLDLQNVPLVSDLAEKLHISEYKLQSVFKNITGHTVYEYIQKCKMEKAKIMLKETSFSVLEIANELGYSNPSKFARVFKKITHKTPIQFRNA